MRKRTGERSSESRNSEENRPTRMWMRIAASVQVAAAWVGLGGRTFTVTCGAWRSTAGHAGMTHGFAFNRFMSRKSFSKTPANVFLRAALSSQLHWLSREAARCWLLAARRCSKKVRNSEAHSEVKHHAAVCHTSFYCRRGSTTMKTGREGRQKDKDDEEKEAKEWELFNIEALRWWQEEEKEAEYIKGNS